MLLAVCLGADTLKDLTEVEVSTLQLQNSAYTNGNCHCRDIRQKKYATMTKNNSNV